MLHDFTYYNPTKIHFGKEAMSKLPSEQLWAKYPSSLRKKLN